MAQQLREGSILIVCEGEKTENYFLADLYSLLVEKDLCAIDYPDIVPAPVRDTDVDKIPSNRKRGGRCMNKATRQVKAEPVLSGTPPMNWVNAALEGLEAHSEAWVVFDHDDHLARKQAFEKVKEEREKAKNINIAFSSRSFEYYMLQHYEYLYHRFDYTECHGGKHEYCNCCHPVKQPLAGACDGELTTQGQCCINGYARKRNYWVESKKSDVFSQLPSLWRGIMNACRIKWESISQNPKTPMYERNPYLNTYCIVLRFMGMESLEYDHPISNKGIGLELDDEEIKITNSTDTTFILSGKDIPVYCPSPVSERNNESRLRLIDEGCLKRTIIESKSVASISIAPLINAERFSVINVKGKKVFVSYIPPIDKS